MTQPILLTRQMRKLLRIEVEDYGIGIQQVRLLETNGLLRVFIDTKENVHQAVTISSDDSLGRHYKDILLYEYVDAVGIRSEDERLAGMVRLLPRGALQDFMGSCRHEVLRSDPTETIFVPETMERGEPFWTAKEKESPTSS